MKLIKYLIIIIFALLISNTAIAQKWWTANARVNVSQVRIDGSVFNGFDRPIYCTGRVIGFTYHGNKLWSYMKTVIYPGNYSYVYVHTNKRDGFVSGDADIKCRWYW